MGKFLDFLTGGGSGLAGSIINGAVQLWQGKKNRDAQQAENAKDRAFNAEQAQVNRQWQEKMFELHESPAAQAQARAQAGLSPTEGISSQSVGSGSTASASSSSLPPAQAPNFGDAISQLPFIVQQYKQSKAQTQGLELDNEIKLQDYENRVLDNYRKAFENGNLEEVFKREMRLIDAQGDDYIAGAKLKDINRKNLSIAYANAKSALDDGINPVVDEHNESNLRQDLMSAQTETERARVIQMLFEQNLATERFNFERMISNERLSLEERMTNSNILVNEAMNALRSADLQGVLTENQILEYESAIQQYMRDYITDGRWRADQYGTHLVQGLPSAISSIMTRGRRR